MISFFAALQFLTIVPPVVRRDIRAAELGRSVASYPLVGLLMGVALLGASRQLASVFSPWIVAGVILMLWVLASGGIHMDGLMDAADGIFGGKTTEQRLNIMRDERVGAFGVLAAILLMLLKFVALAEGLSDFPALVLAPVIGRWTMSLAIVTFPYARSQGLGSALKREARPLYLVIATLIGSLICFLTAGLQALFVMGIAGLCLILLGQFVTKRVGGFTGDIYGGANELMELLVLLFFSLNL